MAFRRVLSFKPHNKEYVVEIMNKYFYGLVKRLTSKKGTSTKAIQEQEIERIKVINESNKKNQ